MQNNWPILTNTIAHTNTKLLVLVILFKHVNKKYGELIFREKISTIQKILISASLLFGSLLILVPYQIFITRNLSIYQSVIGMTIIITMFSLCFLGTLFIRSTLIFENGIIPAWRSPKAVFLFTSYFIPYNQINKICYYGLTYENAMSYWLLMKDDTFAECTPNDKSINYRITETFIQKIPHVPILKIKLNPSDSNISPNSEISIEQIFVNDSGRKRKRFYPYRWECC